MQLVVFEPVMEDVYRRVDGVHHRTRVRLVAAGEVVGRTVVRGGADDRKSRRVVHPVVEGQGLELADSMCMLWKT